MTDIQSDLSKARQMLGLGRLTYAAKLFRRALAPLDQSAKSDQVAESLVGLGRIFHTRGDAARAALYAKEALRHDISSKGAKQLLADLDSPNESPEAHYAWRREAGPAPS
jgi:uncharacterized protein HemY